MDWKKKAGCGIFGVHAIFQMPWIMPVKAEETENALSENAADPELYLRKGEKIISLLREKKQHNFIPDIMLEKVKGEWKKTKIAAAKYLGEELERKFMGIMEESGFETARSFFCTSLFPQLNIEEEKGARPLALLNYLCPVRPGMVLRVWWNAEDPVYVPTGTSFKKKHEPLCKFRKDKGPYMRIANLDSLLGELALRRYLLNKLRSMKKESGGTAEYAQIPAIGKLQAWMRERLENNGLPYMKEKKLHAGILLFYPESKEAEEAALRVDEDSLNYILCLLRVDYKKRQEEARMEKELSGDYAKSFQTKKNIPQKYIQAMSKSRFNRYFGYVEFDAECDLGLMDEICKEYEVLAEELGLPRYEEVSLRFRKLGYHKASGLYYYTLKCLCVDVRSPGSFVHEVGHMIDYHMDHISAKYIFHQVYDRYEYLLKEFMESSNSRETDVLRGRTKYNIKYYLQPTEVFARCFEMYLSRIRKIDNSLLKMPVGFAYPEDKTLDMLLEEFYTQLLCGLEEGKKTAA